MTAIAGVSPDPLREDESIPAILALLREHTGTDFAQYREATVVRRIRNRMISLGIASGGEYLRMLSGTAGEAAQLLERITIKVSRFYRNKPVFDTLRNAVFPWLAQRGEPLRIWSIGCGCGEEPYTLALLLEACGVAGTVHATDIDHAALRQAVAAEYPESALAELPEDLAERYLARVPSAAAARYRVRDEARRRVVFERHDITSDDRLPGGKAFDLVACRNVVIYLKREVQQQAFRRMRRAVAAGGYLCLGEAEWPPAALEETLEPVASRKTRIFRAVGGFAGAGA